MNYNALIVEDESLAAQRLQRILSDVAPDIKPLETLGTVRDVVQYFEAGKTHPDLLFLDIHLADGSAFEVLEQLAIDVPIIFTTAYDQYALQAFKTYSVDYLLKPIRPSELQQSIEKFKSLFAHTPSGSPSIDYQQLAKALRETNKTYTQRFLVQVRDRIRAVTTEEIAVFFSMAKSTYFLTLEGKQFDLSSSLEHLNNELDPERFYRASRKAIVQREAIKEVILFSRSRLKLELLVPCPVDIFVPADRSSHFKKWLGS